VWGSCTESLNLKLYFGYELTVLCRAKKKTSQQLDPDGWLQDLPQALLLLACSPPFKCKNPNGSPSMGKFFISNTSLSKYYAKPNFLLYREY
jgi:hypothetical protein